MLLLSNSVSIFFYRHLSFLPHNYLSFIALPLYLIHLPQLISYVPHHTTPYRIVPYRLTAETVFVPLIRHCSTNPDGPEAQAHIQEIKVGRLGAGSWYTTPCILILILIRTRTSQSSNSFTSPNFVKHIASYTQHQWLWACTPHHITVLLITV